jgi:hypothetical protein
MNRDRLGTDSGQATKPTMFRESSLSVLHGQPLA